MEEEAQRDHSHAACKLMPLQLREQYHLNIADLAWKAKVAPGTVYFMMVRSPVPREEAEQVLATISTLTGQAYTLETVDVVLAPEPEEQAAQRDEEPPYQ